MYSAYVCIACFKNISNDFHNDINNTIKLVTFIKHILLIEVSAGDGSKTLIFSTELLMFEA